MKGRHAAWQPLPTSLVSAHLQLPLHPTAHCPTPHSQKRSDCSTRHARAAPVQEVCCKAPCMGCKAPCMGKASIKPQPLRRSCSRCRPPPARASPASAGTRPCAAASANGCRPRCSSAPCSSSSTNARGAAPVICAAGTLASAALKPGEAAPLLLSFLAHHAVLLGMPHGLPRPDRLQGTGQRWPARDHGRCGPAADAQRLQGMPRAGRGPAGRSR